MGSKYWVCAINNCKGFFDKVSLLPYPDSSLSYLSIKFSFKRVVTNPRLEEAKKRCPRDLPEKFDSLVFGVMLVIGVSIIVLRYHLQEVCDFQTD